MSSKNIKLLFSMGVWEVRDTDELLYFESEDYETSLNYALNLANKQNSLLEVPAKEGSVTAGKNKRT